MTQAIFNPLMTGPYCHFMMNEHSLAFLALGVENKPAFIFLIRLQSSTEKLKKNAT